MKKEIAVSKEGMTLARSKFEPMEKENTNLRVEIKHLQEVSYQWVSHDSSNWFIIVLYVIFKMFVSAICPAHFPTNRVWMTL